MSAKNIALANYLFFKIYNFFRRSRYKRVQIQWLDRVDVAKIELKNEEVCEIHLPKFNEFKEIKIMASPQVYIHCFENAVARIDSSGFLINGVLVMERNLAVDDSMADYSSGLIRLHDEKHAMLHYEGADMHIGGTSLFLGGSGSSNYYHWLIEILPKLLLVNEDMIKEMGIDKIVVSEDCASVRSFHESLNVILGEGKIGLNIYFVPKVNLLFDKVFHINSFNYTLINSKSKKITAEMSFYSKYVLIDYSNRLSRYANGSGRSPKKIFLLRGAGGVANYNKRDYNQDEIFSILSEFGFEGIFFESYSFSEQVRLFYNASHVVGPSGAFWSNIIFCRQGCKALSWLSCELSEFSVYSTLAAYFHCDMRFLESNLVSPGNMHGAYHLDGCKLREFLQSPSIDFLS